MAASTNVGADVGAGGGDWLFREGEMVLGPVPARQIIDKLYSGELTGRSEVSPLGTSQFHRIAEVDFFKVHLAKAEAKLRVEALAQSQRSKSQRSRNVKIAVVASICVVVAGGAAFAARYLAVHNPFKNADELAFGDITVEPPTITLAKASHMKEEELLEYPGGPGQPKLPPGTRPPTGGGSSPIAKRPPSGGKSSGLTAASEDPDGLQTAQFDRSGINSVVASKQRTLYACFAEEAQRKPGFSAKIPIEFVIGNDGRVSKLWVDHPDYKQGALADCLFKELQKWPFKSYQGEQATVGLSFKIGKGG